MNEHESLDWKEVEALDNESNIYSLFLSDDESILGATHLNKFTIWFLGGPHANCSVTMNLPKDIRNFPR